MDDFGMYDLATCRISDGKPNTGKGGERHAPNRCERIEALGCTPRQTFLLDLVLEVTCRHIYGKGYKPRMMRISGGSHKLVKCQLLAYRNLRCGTLHRLV